MNMINLFQREYRVGFSHLKRPNGIPAFAGMTVGLERFFKWSGFFCGKAERPKGNPFSSMTVGLGRFFKGAGFFCGKAERPKGNPFSGMAGECG